MTDLKRVPAIPRPDMMIGKNGITGPGYAYLDELSKVLTQVRSLLGNVEETALSTVDRVGDAEGALAEIAASSAILRKRNDKVARGSSTSASTGQKSIVSDEIRCLQEDGRVCIYGNVNHSHGSGGDDADGTVIQLYVDGAYSGLQMKDWASATAAVINTPFSFMYEPNDTLPHTYEIRASATVSAIYGVACWMQLEEIAPNPV